MFEKSVHNLLTGVHVDHLPVGRDSYRSSVVCGYCFTGVQYFYLEWYQQTMMTTVDTDVRQVYVQLKFI
ncbi:hypothetical protein TSPI_07250 [Trichinella spiralis]|uniref:Uncharacterized protein n=1 Tax=Trichinella spiralis TaxID=6334 RepID=A0ABR3KFD8_TRISP